MSGRPALPWRVDVLAYPGCFGGEVFGFVDVLAIANALSAALRPGTGAPLRTRIVAARDGGVRLANGVTVQAEPARRSGPVDQIIVPGFELVDPAHLDRLLTGWAPEVAFLRSLAGRPTAVASVCVGAFLLADAGLLDGRAATTSWLFAPELGRRYPKVDVRSSEMIVEDGTIATAGAFSAGTDLALRVVGQRAGDRVARATARVTLASPVRASQAPFVDERLLPVPPARFSDDVRAWLRHHVAEPYNLTALSASFNVSTRTMLRRFAAETGTSPLAFLQQARIATAKRLLESSDLAVHAILRQVGYRDAATFRRLFVELTGLTPSDYRRQFRRPPG